MSSSMTGVASGSGSLTQLVAIGAMDQHLTKDATMTFFRQRYAKHSLFSLETVAQPFNTTPSFGGDSAITLNRQGDLIHWQYIQIRLPGLSVTPRNSSLPVAQQAFPSDDQEAVRHADDDYIVGHIPDGYTQASEGTKTQLWAQGNENFQKVRFNAGFPDPTATGNDLPDFDYAYYTEAIGFHLIRSAELKLGGSIVDTVWSQLLFAWEELSGKSGRRLCEQVGRTLRQPRELMKLSRTSRTLYVPLPFSYTRHPSLALPLVAMQYHSLQLTVQWATLSSCIIKSSQDLVVTNAESGAPLQDSDLKATVLTTYIQLDNAERNKFATSNLRQLITQHQRFTQPINGSANVSCKLTFSFPVQELIFMVRRVAMTKANDHFCYDGICGREPVEQASLSFNNSIRFSAEGRWLRTVQPLQHHSSVPLSNIYSYSFALQPESIEPSGSANFSRIDSVDLNLVLQDEFASEPAELFVFARSWNILSFSAGLAGIGFSS